MAFIRDLMPVDKKDISSARASIKSLEEKIGREGIMEKALQLLEGGVAYVEGDMQEKSLAHLPMELRQLIMEVYKGRSEQSK